MNSVCIRAESSVYFCRGGTRSCILKSVQYLQFPLSIKLSPLKSFLYKSVAREMCVACCVEHMEVRGGRIRIKHLDYHCHGLLGERFWCPLFPEMAQSETQCCGNKMKMDSLIYKIFDGDKYSHKASSW